MSHSYSEVHLHIVWRTRNSERVLVGDVERVAHEEARLKALSFRGVIVRALDGIEDHIHLAVTIPPTLLISDFIGKVKGASSFGVNARFPNSPHFSWQEGYGVVSFGTRAMQWVVDCINNQKQHHAAGKVYERLERIEEPGPLSAEASKS